MVIPREQELEIVLPPNKLDLKHHDIADLIAFLHCSWCHSLLLSDITNILEKSWDVSSRRMLSGGYVRYSLY